ncbi:MAG: hypothetical protein JST01_24525 [Cyanobacteria bacterium SZAS TMP-1]|nr:hypothetical protein [Cyanobacteria bacterium SZAS TMP-1]
MKTNTTGARVHVVTSIVVKTFVGTPLAVTAVFGSNTNLVHSTVLPRAEGELVEEVSLHLTEDFDLDSDYLVAVTRSGVDGEHCQYTLLAGVAPPWFAHPEQETFNPLCGSDCMDIGPRLIVALPLSFIADRLAHEKPRV